MDLRSYTKQELALLYFPDDSGKQSWCLLCVISEEHEVITLKSATYRV